MFSLQELSMLRVMQAVRVDEQTRTAVCPYCGAETAVVKGFFRRGELEEVVEVSAADVGCEHHEGKDAARDGAPSVFFVMNLEG